MSTNSFLILEWQIYLSILVLVCLAARRVEKSSDQQPLPAADDFDYDISDTYIERRPPFKMDPPYRNPYQPIRKRKQVKKKLQPGEKDPADSLCVRVLKKKKAELEKENPPKKVVISGNRWHGPVHYGEYKWQPKKHEQRRTKIRDITPVERKLHKCYKWVNSQELKLYEWPAIIQTIEHKDLFHIEICCPNFGPLRVMGNTLCRPFCSSCRNGDCVAPEKCRCFDGYVLSDNGECVFTCPISCLNGRCNLLMAACLCNQGYTLDQTAQFCRPICQSGCGRNPLHNCTAPEVCGCVKGYSLTDNDCQPLLPIKRDVTYGRPS